jgi:hypothetical protein
MFLYSYKENDWGLGYGCRLRNHCRASETVWSKLAIDHLLLSTTVGFCEYECSLYSKFTKKRCAGCRRRARFAYAEKLTDRKNEAKERFRETLLIWLSFWRDVMLVAAKADAPPVNADRTDEIEALAARLSLAEARRLVSDLERAVGRLEKNVNARLLAEVLLLDWRKIK